MKPRTWPTATNTTDLLHEIRRGSEALIARDPVDNAVAEWLAVTYDEMEDAGAREVVTRIGGERDLLVVDGMDQPQADWTVAQKVARAAVERQGGTR